MRDISGQTGDTRLRVLRYVTDARQFAGILLAAGDRHATRAATAICRRKVEAATFDRPLRVASIEQNQRK